MKIKKILALIFFLVGVIACVVAFQRFIVYQNASNSSRGYGYDAERGTGQKRMDSFTESDSQNELAFKAKNQAIIFGLTGGVIIIITLLWYLADRNKGKHTIAAKNG